MLNLQLVAAGDDSWCEQSSAVCAAILVNVSGNFDFDCEQNVLTEYSSCMFNTGCNNTAEVVAKTISQKYTAHTAGNKRVDVNLCGLHYVCDWSCCCRHCAFWGWGCYDYGCSLNCRWKQWVLVETIGCAAIVAGKITAAGKRSSDLVPVVDPFHVNQTSIMCTDGGLCECTFKAAKTKNAAIVSNGAARVGGLRDTSIMLFAAAYALMLIVHLL